MSKKINIAIFFNNNRGIETFNYLSKKRNILIKNIFLAKKFLNKNIVKILKKKKIKFRLINKINDNKNLSIIKKNKIDINILCGFPYILKKYIINSSKYGTLNLHAGKLPEYRGGSPLNWQIINDEKYIGISVIKVNSGIDTGQIITKKRFILKKTYHIKKVHEISNTLFPVLTYKAIKKILNKKYKKISLTKLKNSKYYPQRSEKDGRINWNTMNSKKIYNLVRAISDPYPGAFTFNKKKEKIIINDCKIVKFKKKGFKNGEVKKNKKFFFIKTFDKFIKIKSIKGRLFDKEVLQS
jgi:methionyl-tRNA formyltransferase